MEAEQENNVNVDETQMENENYVAQQQRQNPSLLLAYTYFLNNNGSKSISSGFEISKCEAVLNLNDTKRDCLHLTPYDWYCLYVKFKKISEILHRFNNNHNSEKIHTKIVLSKHLCIFIVREEDSLCSIYLQKKKNEVKNVFKFNYLEFYTLYSLSEFLNTLITYNKNASPLVRNYFDCYVKKCIENKVILLEPKHFFTYNTFNEDHVNYSRLFYEIAHLCGSKILTEITQKNK